MSSSPQWATASSMSHASAGPRPYFRAIPAAMSRNDASPFSAK
ncbi:hypothetical protein [Amycolatopsis orientalis]|nr:hypothetical protein [Amycolatopsis orientalis]